MRRYEVVKVEEQGRLAGLLHDRRGIRRCAMRFEVQSMPSWSDFAYGLFDKKRNAWIAGFQEKDDADFTAKCFNATEPILKSHKTEGK